MRCWQGRPPWRATSTTGGFLHGYLSDLGDSAGSTRSSHLGRYKVEDMHVTAGVNRVRRMGKEVTLGWVA